MKIAYYTDTPRIGGAERYFANAAAAAADAGAEIVVLSPQEELLRLMSEAVPAARVEQVGDAAFASAPSRRRRALLLAGAVPQLRSAFKQAAPDLVHVNNGGYPGSDLNRVAAIAARLATVPRRLFNVHSMPWPRDASQPHVQAAVDRAVWGAVHGVLCPAEAVGRSLQKIRALPGGLYRYVPYGVAVPDGAEAADTLRRRLAPGGELIAVMVSATGDREKGHAVFAEALARVPGVRGVVVGPHPGGEFLAMISRLGIEDRLVVEEGFRPAGPYYHAADMVVVPSTSYECLPLVVLEGMAASKPVFGSRLAGIPEAIEDGRTGHLFPPGDVDELAKLLADAIVARDHLPELGARGRGRWEKRFSLSALSAAVLEVYDEESA